MTLADEDSPVFLAGGVGVVQAMYAGVTKVAAAFRGDDGVSWADHHPCLFKGTARFFRPGGEPRRELDSRP